MDRAPEVHLEVAHAEPSRERWRQERLRSAEAHRDAAQIALFAGHEAVMLAHVKAAIADEDAAAATINQG